MSATAGLAISLIIVAAPAQAAFPGANGKFLFTGNSGTATVNSNGTNLTNIATDASYGPTWSPDGKKIAFSTTRDGNYEIYVMNADGTGQTRVTNNAADDYGAEWSPDGQKFAFVSSRDNAGHPEIYVMNINGTGVTRLTNNATADDNEPVWAPDGQKIAFSKVDLSLPGSYEIYVMNTDGTGQTDLTNSPYVEETPDWSPDGKKITYWGGPGNLSIFAMNADGTGQTNLTNHAGDDRYPSWSPDGTKIAFRRGDNSDIYTVNPDGTAINRVTTGSGIQDRPAWQPLYEIPKSASPIDVSLTPVFKQCGTPGNPSNTTHGPPDIPGGANPDPSCTPATPTASRARVGIQAVGSAQLTVIPGDLSTTTDEADYGFAVDFTDVRTSSQTGADYNPNGAAADLTLVTRLRITDTQNGSFQASPGTVVELDFLVPVDCSATPDPAIGAHCSANTTADAVVPGVIKEGKSTSVNVFRVRLLDSGPNGVRGDSDDSLFAQQGSFIP